MPEQPSPERHPEKQKRSDNPLVQVARYSHIGFMLPAAAMVGYGLGWMLDRWLGTTWIQIVGVILGIIAGFVEVLRLVLRETD